MGSIALFLVTIATFLRLKLSRGTIITANNWSGFGQPEAMVK